MSVTTLEGELADGLAALARADWPEARERLAAVVAISDDPEALDGLGRALWWLRDGRGAVVQRERAYAAFRRDGDLARAARIAVWLSREYALAWGNMAAANGWLARAERILADLAPGSVDGWLELARSERARRPQDAAALATTALGVAQQTADHDLEVRALAQLGLSEVAAGDVDRGLGRLDEAMAAVTAGETSSFETFADVCCTLLLACDLAGETGRAEEWTAVLESFARSVDHVPLLAFCRTCCAGVHAAGGRVDEAESELVAALQELEESGQRSRCAHPAARLAEIRLLQGRLAEAEQLLSGWEDAPESFEARVQLRLALGEPRAAARLLEERLDEVGAQSLLAAPVLARLVEARLAEGAIEDARVAAARLDLIAEYAGRDRVLAQALVARGRVAYATDAPESASLLRDGLNRFAALGLRLDAARARLALAEAVARTEPAEAADVARRAHAELDALGASREADSAAALLRALGGKPRSGPRSIDALTRRELEVLRLLGEGKTNADIARALVISPKTVEHHVARIYRKLDLRTRGEAAAYATRTLGSR